MRDERIAVESSRRHKEKKSQNDADETSSSRQEACAAHDVSEAVGYGKK